ncbi:hypothetical protein DBV15_04761 [Temnothorax longispinosus]|uniref:Secreted protein n=1 Tax=Temnothorax longispinosus TaxID=300112 RepID=A0A4S2L066_9HYME|nr:hypothetical protein DBV15_04761 [Temnothorax longispinosus]
MSANIQLSVALFSCCIPFSRAYSYTVVPFSPMNFNENPRGERRPLRVVPNAAVALNRSSRPSACRLRPLLIRHSFLMTANKFGLSIFPPLNRASQLGGGHTSPLTTEATMTIRLPLARAFGSWRIPQLA